MSDRKQSRPQRKRKGKRSMIPRAPRLNETVMRLGWTNSTVSSGTSGTISQTSGFSIQESTEYSALANLFGEVKLLSATMFLVSGRANDTTTANAQIYMGYDIRYNSVTATNPTSRANQMALPSFRLWNPMNATRPLVVRMPIPKNLEFTRIDQDTPTTVIPYAGSPGVWSMWADGAAVSTGYASSDTRAVFWLRYRI